MRQCGLDEGGVPGLDVFVCYLDDSGKDLLHGVIVKVDLFPAGRNGLPARMPVRPSRLSSVAYVTRDLLPVKTPRAINASTPETPMTSTW